VSSILSQIFIIVKMIICAIETHFLFMYYNDISIKFSSIMKRFQIGS